MAGNIFLEGPVRLTAGLDRQSNGQPADMPVSFPHCIQYTKNLKNIRNANTTYKSLLSNSKVVGKKLFHVYLYLIFLTTP